MQITFNPNIKYNQKYKVNFKGVPEDFGKVLLKASDRKSDFSALDRVNLYKQFELAIKEIINPKRLINQGFFNNVYKIDENFVAKVKKKFVSKPWLVGKELNLGKNEFKNLKTYFGEELMDIGGIKILKNIGKHVPAGVPEIMTSKMQFDDEVGYYNNIYLPLFADVPQENYDAIAKDFKTLNEMKISNSDYHYDFDSRNPNNIALSDDKGLVMVDDIDVRATDNTNDTSKLFRIFLLSITRNDSIYFYDDVGLEAARKIFKKIVLATERAELPNLDKAQGLKYWNFVFKNLRVRKIPESFVYELEENRKKIPNMDKRLQKAEEAIDKILATAF